MLRNFENAAGEPVEDWVTASRRAVHTGVATLRRLRPLVRQLLALSAGADHAAAVCRLAESLVERVRRLHHLIDPIVVGETERSRLLVFFFSFLPSLTVFYRILPRLTYLYRVFLVLPSFTEFYRDLLSFTDF